MASSRADNGDSSKLDHRQYDIYTQGKQMTKILAKWLVAQSSKGAKIKCGYTESTRNIPSSSKGISRKHLANEAQRATKATKSSQSSSTLRPSQFLQLAHDVVRQAPSVEIPSYIHAVRNSVRFRRMCWSFFKHHTEPDVIASNQSHLAFVRILEQVHSVLLNAQPTPTPPATTEDSIEEDIQSVQNMFDMLRDFSQEFPAEVQLSSAAVPSLSGNNMVTSVEAADPLSDFSAIPSETQVHYRKVCIYKCLLRDVARLRAYVQEKWGAYVRGEMPLAVVAGLTNQAIDQVLHLEEAYQKSTKERCAATFSRLKFGNDFFDRSTFPTSIDFEQTVDVLDGEFDLERWLNVALAFANKTRARIARAHMSSDDFQRKTFGLHGITTTNHEDIELLLLSYFQNPTANIKLDREGRLMDRELLLQRVRRRSSRVDSLQLLRTAESRLAFEYSKLTDGFNWARLQDLCWSLHETMRVRHFVRGASPLMSLFGDGLLNFEDQKTMCEIWYSHQIMPLLQMAMVTDMMNGARKQAAKVGLGINGEEELREGYDTSVEAMLTLIEKDGSAASAAVKKQIVWKNVGNASMRTGGRED